MRTRKFLGACVVALFLGACGPEYDANNVGQLETSDPATQPEVLFFGADVEHPALRDEMRQLPKLDETEMFPVDTLRNEPPRAWEVRPLDVPFPTRPEAAQQ